MAEGRDLGNGVLFVVSSQDGRLAGSPSMLQELWAFTVVWRADSSSALSASQDIDEARAAAEHLAQERADG